MNDQQVNEEKFTDFFNYYFENNIPNKFYWDNADDIVDILAKMLTYKIRLEFQSGGWNDIDSVQICSHDSLCIELNLDDLPFIIKPEKLIFDSQISHLTLVHNSRYNDAIIKENINSDITIFFVK